MVSAASGLSGLGCRRGSRRRRGRCGSRGGSVFRRRAVDGRVRRAACPGGRTRCRRRAGDAARSYGGRAPRSRGGAAGARRICPDRVRSAEIRCGGGAERRFGGSAARVRGRDPRGARGRGSVRAPLRAGRGGAASGGARHGGAYRCERVRSDVGAADPYRARRKPARRAALRFGGSLAAVGAPGVFGGCRKRALSGARGQPVFGRRTGARVLGLSVWRAREPARWGGARGFVGVCGRLRAPCGGGLLGGACAR